MRKFILIFSLFVYVVACEKDENDKPAETNETNNVTNNNGNNNPSDSTNYDNSYMFSDDQIECFPNSSNPSIGSIGLLSLVSKPCQNSGSKLDGYFKYGGRPIPGTYTVVGEIGKIPQMTNLATDEYSMVFYGHGSSTLYAVGGTVEVSKNASDTSKLDLNWQDVDMAFKHDSSIIHFSGNLKGL